MDNKYLSQVLEQLENYQIMIRQIELLRYEIRCAEQISPTEMIEVMTFQKRGANDDHTDTYPTNVPEIAASYQHAAAKLSGEVVEELISKYAGICRERDRLLHYIGLLNQRQQAVIRKYYLEQQSWSEIADSMNSTPRTAQRLRQQAVNDLAELYAFARECFLI